MQSIRRSVECANNFVDVANSNYTSILRCYTRDTLTFMLLLTIHQQIEMINLNFQVTLPVKKGPTP